MENYPNPNPNPNPVPNPNYVSSTPYSTVKPLSGWATFFGVLIIICGALYSITIIGAIVGVPFIIAGVKLTKAVSLSKELRSYEERQKMDLVFDNLNAFFKINGIMIVISFCLGILAAIIMAVVGAAFMSNYQG